MNVLLVSQCDKRALTETRRILDQFGERRGDRTWQTPITMDGLNTLRKLLRKTARKNTAVACHWIRGTDHSELIWIVGDASRFNAIGAVPTNTTVHDVLRTKDENDWHSADAIRALATMAALFHDFGKASVRFQAKLRALVPTADPYRHEWVSLRLFQALVHDCADDAQWLQRLQALPSAPLSDWLERLWRLRDHPIGDPPMQHLPPLAQAVGWLILTHHRLPERKANAPAVFSDVLAHITAEWTQLTATSNDAEAAKLRGECWEYTHGLPDQSAAWCAAAAERAGRMLARLKSLTRLQPIHDPYLMHLARMSLMLADHHYSSQDAAAGWSRTDYPVYANTRGGSGSGASVPKQMLDEHLVMVAKHASRIVRKLPTLDHALPRIGRAPAFRARARDARFQWQNRAFDLACGLRQSAGRQGFFGLNMASTGCGKTLANARILYALADPNKGARFSIALGLRTLTLQTGSALRERLELDEDHFATLVGGAAVRELYESQRRERVGGSESADELLPEHSSVLYSGNLDGSPLGEWLAGQRGSADRLLQAPVVACTIDHLMPACEGVRGGRQIVPMLRLLTSDLVLDEVDDFGLDDLPAVARLVYFAGMLGSRVLLSSATLAPALVQGLFQAFCEGRRLHQRHRGMPGLPLDVVCAWFDEFGAAHSTHVNGQSYAEAHQSFVARRLVHLKVQPPRRLGKLVDMPVVQGTERALRTFAGTLLREIQDAHQHHAQTDSRSGKRISIGLVRMANINPLVAVARVLFECGTPKADTAIRLCVYHSQHPLLVRNAIESRLDRLLRRNDPDALFADPELRHWFDTIDARELIVVVLATPVCEIGRDHDYDYAIVEPSSMRSIVQVAGRVLRHRIDPPTQANVLLLSRNVKAMGGSRLCFTRPGFEQNDLALRSHDLSEVLLPEQYQQISAAPCIEASKPLLPRERLADLEHTALQRLLLDPASASSYSAQRYWQTQSWLTGVEQSVRRFRAGEPTQTWRVLPGADDPAECQVQRQESDRRWSIPKIGRIEWKEASIRPWLAAGFQEALDDLAARMDLSPQECAERFGQVELRESLTADVLSYNPVLGFFADGQAG